MLKNFLSKLSLSILLCLICFGCTAQQSVKEALLKNVFEIPMPDSTHYTSTFFAISSKAQVIAMADAGPPRKLFVSTIMASEFGKGKMVALGSEAYFKAGLLNNPSVARLILNAVDLNPNNKNVGVLDGNKELIDFFAKNKIKALGMKVMEQSKNLGTIFIAQGVKDSVLLSQLELFVKNGGTVVYGSPFGTIFLKRNKSQPVTDDIKGFLINDLLTKAGIFNGYSFLKSGAVNFKTQTDSIPDYLIYPTLIPWLSNETNTESEMSMQMYTAISALKLAIEYNDLHSPDIMSIKFHYKLSDTLPVPTSDHPLDISKEYAKLRYQTALWLDEKRLDPDKNPTINPASRIFPGEVPKSALRVKRALKIDVKVGTQGLADMPSVYFRPHSTGLYAAPGERIVIDIDPKYLKQGLKIQIGVHDDDLMNTEKLIRTGTDLTKIVELNKPSTEIFSQYGGLLLLNIADTCTLKDVEIKISGAVKAPYFKLGETTDAQWVNEIRNNPGPWAELATDKIVLTVPSYRIRNLATPTALMNFYDEVMDADAELAHIDKKRIHQERVIVDAQVAYGYMFTQLYKIVVPDDESCKKMLDEKLMREKGSWGLFHELGHRHQFWRLDFKALSEVTVNLYTMYVYDKVLNKGIYNHPEIPSRDQVFKDIKKYIDQGASYEKWSDDPFLALRMYIQLIDKFGWEPIFLVNKEYRKMGLPSYQDMKSDQQRRDLWFVEICKATKTDLGDFFDAWKVPVTAEAKSKVLAFQKWFPEELKKDTKQTLIHQH